MYSTFLPTKKKSRRKGTVTSQISLYSDRTTTGGYRVSSVLHATLSLIVVQISLFTFQFSSPPPLDYVLKVVRSERSYFPPLPVS